ncbi:pH-sensitive chloride channel 2-like [Chironomus tepperi]|uniref:pH-sensitive chloride channel 2-like n=1 Tax=Chironomus tepperi TaxID=113505 RepID=UPI00391F6378
MTGSDPNCLPSKNRSLTQSELFKRLTDPCRYDKIQRPQRFDANGKSLPVDVYIRAYIFYIQNLDTHNLQFTIQMRFQIRYNDQRLVFNNVGSVRTEVILGEEDLRRNLWTPHVFFVNERSSGILGTHQQDVITAVHSDGTVIVSSRIQVSLYCSMEFKNFPLDQQQCKSTIGSWIYNISDVKLHWELIDPFTMGTEKILTEYKFKNTSLDETEIDTTSAGLHYGDFVGNYSALIFTIALDRSLGFYLLDYYFPSILLVAVSWVSFWLQADQTAPRAMLGTSAMLAFITLSSSQNRPLPKVSYIKFSEVWFIVCALFIFASLVEFAFVNLLWRRRKDLVLEKVTTVNILKKTLKPSIPLKSIKYKSEEIRKSRSDTTLDKLTKENGRENYSFAPRFSVPNQRSNCNLVTPSNSSENVNSENSNLDTIVEVPSNTPEDYEEDYDEKTTLTHKEIAILLDREARLVFPLAFLFFNIIYWILVHL